MTAYFTLTTTDGSEAVIPVPPGQDRWLLAVRYVNEYCPGSDSLADVQPATPHEIAAFQAEHPTLVWSGCPATAERRNLQVEPVETFRLSLSKPVPGINSSPRSAAIGTVCQFELPL
jgi:hypothetical protein